MLNKSIGIFFIFLSILSYTIRDVITKTSLNIPSIQIVFFVSIFGVIVLFIYTYKECIIRTKINFWLLASRGFFGFLATSTFFYNLTHVSFTQSVAYMQSSVVFSAILSFVFLKKNLSPVQWIAIPIGLIGILLVSNINFEISKNNIVGFICAISSALAYMSIKELKNYYNYYVIVFSFLIFSAIFSFLGLVIAEFYHYEPIDFLISPFIPIEFPILFTLILVSIFSTFGQIYKTKAYGNGKTGVIGAFGYSRVLFALVFGLILGDTWPGMLTIFGVLLVIISGIMIILSTNNKDHRNEI